MTETLTLLVVGLLLLGLLIVLLRRTESAADERYSQSNDGSLAASLRFQDRRNEILDRIFGREDWDFVLGHGSKEVRRLFLFERRQLALSWLSEIRSQAKAAMSFHVSHAGKSKKLLPMLELRLAIDYFLIRLKCGFIALVVLLGSPIMLRRMMGYASHLSDQLRGLLEIVVQTESFSEKARVSH
jgi:hypothetical protein